MGDVDAGEPKGASGGRDTGRGKEAGEGKTARRPDPKLLELLVCPMTKTTLEYDAAAQELVSRAAHLAYPIRDGIPIMLPDEARKLPD